MPRGRCLVGFAVPRGGCLVGIAVPRGGCRVPPRRAGNFLLLAQKKVTKEKSPNTHLGIRLPGKRSRLMTTGFIAAPGGLTFAASRPHSGCAWSRTRALCAEVFELKDHEGARRQESAEGSPGAHRSSQVVGSLHADVRPNRVQGLFFGDFLLARQKKVTRPPGRDPASPAGHRVRRSESPHRSRPPGRDPATPAGHRDPQSVTRPPERNPARRRRRHAEPRPCAP